MTVQARRLWMPAAILGSVAVGLVAAWSFVLALAFAETLVFVLAYRVAPWSVLVVPVAWAVLGDPVFLGMTGLTSSLTYRALDLWTILGLGVFTLSSLGSSRARRVAGEPAGLGILIFWASFAAAAVLDGVLAPSAPWVGEVRGLLAVGWFFMAASIVRTGQGRQVGRLFGLAILGMIVKGGIYWFMGTGVLDIGNLAGYRAFGSEEATAGLLLLAAGTGAATAGKQAGRWPVYAMVCGTVLLTLSALRAFWLAGALMEIGILAVGALSSARRARRILAALAGLCAVGALFFATIGNGLYEASIAPRLSTLNSPATVLATDTSLGYRLIEWSTVRQAVGSHVLLGRGLGAQHRAVYWYNPGDPALWAELAGYVHNTFLWAFLKAGFLGVAAAVVLYGGFLVQTVRAARRSSSPGLRQVATSLSIAVLALVVVGLFNAHIAVVRYMIIVGLVFGTVAGLSLRDRGVGAPA